MVVCVITADTLQGPRCSSISIEEQSWPEVVDDELTPTTMSTLTCRVFFGTHSQPGRSRHNPVKDTNLSSTYEVQTYHILP